MKLSLEMSGFGELDRELKRLSQKAEALHGEHSVPLKDLFPPSFMRRHSRFDSIEHLLESSGFNVETPADFAAIPDDHWDAFIASVTDFPDWHTMQEAGAGEWVKRGLGL